MAAIRPAVAISQGVTSIASSAAGQWVGTGDVNWNTALKAGLTAGITAGLTRAPVFGNQSLNQLAKVQTQGGIVIQGGFDSGTFAQNLLGMAGRNLLSTPPSRTASSVISPPLAPMPSGRTPIR